MLAHSPNGYKFIGLSQIRQKPGASSKYLTCVAGAQGLGPSSDGFRGIVARNSIKTRVTEHKSATILDASTAGDGLTCYTIMLAPNKFYVMAQIIK